MLKFVFLQRIPKKFISEYGVHLSNMAFLTIPNGTKWKVKLTKCDGEVCFGNGWCEFASCHALALGHLLVFRYEGNSEFSVLIFDVIATEIGYPAAELQHRRMEDNKSDDTSLEIMDDFMPSQKTREKPPVPLPHKRAKTNPSSSKGSRSTHGVGGVAENLVRVNAFKSKNPLYTVTIYPSYVNGKDRAVVGMLCLSLRNAVFGYVLLMPDHVSTADHQLVMAPKRAKRGKCKAAPKPEVVFNQLSADKSGPPPPSLLAMMETIMTTQATHGPVLYGLLANIAALQADLADFRRQVPPSPSSDS
nr:b3 domain-containing transcription factor vrn1 [Quercus suber]